MAPGKLLDGLVSTVSASVLLAILLAAPGAAEEEAVEPYLVVLGIAQDAGYPQAGTKDHPGWDDPAHKRMATSIALVDPPSSQRWFFEATPDFREQLHRLDVEAPHAQTPGIAGIFLTHGHMGHYTGLIHLGREAMGTRRMPVYAMPRMKTYLEDNGPWELLVRLEHVAIRPIQDLKPVRLNPRIVVTPIEVPHRDEYTETVGYEIRGPHKSAFFLPDIDKWERLDEEGRSIEEIIGRVDVAYLDGSFFEDGEIPGRDMAQIPHPFISESIRRFSKLGADERAKIRFIHLNRTNPALVVGSTAQKQVLEAGFGLARELERFGL